MYINRRFYIAVILIILCFIAGYVSDFLYILAHLLLLVLIGLCAVEIFRLYFSAGKQAIRCTRECAERFSNGDENEIRLHLSNSYSFPVSLQIVDEIPDIFQIRDLSFHFKMEKKDDKILMYALRPVKRGVYRFGNVNVFASTKIGLMSRRFKTGTPCEIKVYPSFHHLRQYELQATTSKLTEQGNKRIRKIGQQLEPDHIKDYVKGDDYRIINWKATARKNKLMVNVFQEERAQNLYCIIDQGRTMQSASEGMTLLDYSINATLALSRVAMMKGDKVGLLTFERKMDAFLPASKQVGQMQRIQDMLYAQTTSFLESDFFALYQQVDRHIKHRSLLLVFTNFDSAPAMQRQLEFLAMMAKRHTVMVVFFENTELKEVEKRKSQTKEEFYETVIVEKLSYEKVKMIHKLRQRNIIPLLANPDKLTISTINKYLEIKARGQ